MLGGKKRQLRPLTRAKKKKEIIIEVEDNTKQLVTQDPIASLNLVMEEERKNDQILHDRELALKFQEEEMIANTGDARMKNGGDQQDAKEGEVSNTTAKIDEQESQETIQAPVNKLGEDLGQDNEMLEADGEKIQLIGSEDLFVSQESEDNFCKAVRVILHDEDLEKTEEEKRRSKRLRDGEDKRPADMAVERIESQNVFINKDHSSIPSVIHDSNLSLASMDSLLGVSLGRTLEGVDTNLFLKEKENSLRESEKKS